MVYFLALTVPLWTIGFLAISSTCQRSGSKLPLSKLVSGTSLARLLN
jgi:hypothetical protein